MPITNLKYFYRQTGTGKNGEAVVAELSPTSCQVYQFSIPGAGECAALIYLSSGVVLPYLKPVYDEKYGQSTPYVELSSQTVGQNGMWLTVNVSNLKQ